MPDARTVLQRNKIYFNFYNKVKLLNLYNLNVTCLFYFYIQRTFD